MATIAKFCLCAVPGAVILLVVAPGLLAPGIGGTLPRGLEIAIGVALIPVSAAMILYGTNNWGNWLYVLPVAAALPFFLAPENTGKPIRIGLLALPFIIAWAVRAYYKRQSANGQPPTANF